MPINEAVARYFQLMGKARTQAEESEFLSLTFPVWRALAVQY